MTDELLASYRFRQERQDRWQTLEALIARAEKRGLASLSADELVSLPLLYRAAASSLSVARGISLDANLVAYLESLVTRGYFLVYGARAGLGTLVARFFLRLFPTAVVTARRAILLAAALLTGGVGAGWVITAADPIWFEAFVSASMAQGRDPSATREELAEPLFDAPPAGEQLALFSSFLFQHNARIGMLCFALGAAFGVPVFVLLIYNGLAIGAMCAVYASKDLTVEFLAWLAIHGTTELGAVALCGAAGFHLASGMINPGRRSRMRALAAHGRVATTLAVGAVGMLFVAALLEGLGRQLVTDTAWRLGIGGGMAAIWCAYFALCGRGKRTPGNG